ncbi:MAG: hypothetical protein WBP01_05770, partial [Ferruginibacter sp.]
MGVTNPNKKFFLKIVPKDKTIRLGTFQVLNKNCTNKCKCLKYLKYCCYRPDNLGAAAAAVVDVW